MANIVEIHDLSFAYPKEEVRALDHIHLNIEEGEFLVLDEPTSQLDSIAASDFLETVKKIHRDLGTTIVITEHRLEEIFPAADRVVVMDHGKIYAQGSPAEIGEALRKADHEMFLAMPVPMQVYAEVMGKDGKPAVGFGFHKGSGKEAGSNIFLQCPITVRDGRQWLEQVCRERGIAPAAQASKIQPEKRKHTDSPGYLLDCRDLWFRYEKELPDVVKGASFQIKRGEFYCLLGGNGTGKSTTLSLLCRLRRPYRRKILLDGKDIRKYKDTELFREWEKRELTKRTKVSLFLLIVAIPATVLIGMYFYRNSHYSVGQDFLHMIFGSRVYYFMSLVIMIYAMFPFFMVFEGRRPQARELVILAAMVALNCAGRAAFFMVPDFKPIYAITIISGVAFGGEAGFLVGSMSMLVSNFLFGQGPWTPWQMFALGFIGFLSGILYQAGIISAKRFPLSMFGFLMAFALYGGIMNPAAMFMSIGEPNWKTLIAYYVSGVPVDLVKGASTFLFLWFGSRPMLEKLQRIKVKYGLIN